MGNEAQSQKSQVTTLHFLVFLLALRLPARR
jgi:hypothetical protein